MGKKMKSVLLSMLMIGSLSLGIYAQEETAADQGTALARDPISEFVEGLDPEIYAGIYADENGEYHIAAVEPEVIERQIRASRSVSSDIPVEQVAYSWQDLLDAQAALLEIQDDLGITAVGLDASQNALTVFAGELSEEQKQAVTDASPVKNILFQNDAFLLAIGSGQDDMASVPDADDSGNEIEAAAVSSLQGGDWLQNKAGSNWSTLGYGAFLHYGASNQKQGYVTCGHGYTQGQAVYRGGAKIGTATAVRVSNGVDITFIESSIRYAGQKNGKEAATYGAPVSGKKVYMYGARSGSKDGTIKSTNISGTWESNGVATHHDNIFSFNFPSQSGDSGSVLLMESSPNKYSLVGINIGMWFKNDDKENGELVWGAACTWEKSANAIDAMPRNP